MRLPSRIRFVDEEVGNAFRALASGDDAERRLHEHLIEAFHQLSEDAFSGISIPKRLIPKGYGTENLWKYNLPGAWRLLYSIASDKVLVITIILEWLPHKKYRRRFKY